MSILRFVGVLTAAAVVLSLGVSGGDSSPTVEGRAEGAFNWGVIFTPTPRTIKAGSGVGYCVGDPQPRIARPEVKYRGDDVYIRLELNLPRHPPSEHGRCAGVGLLVLRKITLRRDLSDLRLYDSGVEPPELRWPE